MSIPPVAFLVDYILTLTGPKLLFVPKHKCAHFRGYFKDAKDV